MMFYVIKKSMKFHFLIFLIISLSGCDRLYALLDKRGAEELKLVGESNVYEANPTVSEIQTLLKLYGYAPGRIDGVLGPATRRAIEKFQQDNGLEVTRFADKATWAKLSVFKDNGLVVNGALNVQLIQTLLKEAGFKLGKVDGRFGVKTQEAVQAFQKAHGLKVDGRIGYKTLSKLSEFLIDEENQFE